MNFFDRKYFPFFLLFLIVFISRLPFLSAGHGVEEDSWGIVLAGAHTWLTGVYEPSRFPGHPVHEWIYSSFHLRAPLFYNLFSAFFSAVASVFFALILKELKFRHFFIASLAFAFTPVLYISSTYTIDFVWTIAFILISLYALLKNQFVLCGIFLGLAIGCRITSGAMLLPFMIIFWQKNNLQKNIRNCLKIALPLILVVIVSYWPLVKQFGASFFMYYDQFPYPPFTKVAYKMFPGVFGFIGTVAIAVCILYILVNRKKIVFGAMYANGLSKKIVICCHVVIVLFIISYLRLPQKSGYMITIIPFAIMLFGYYLNSKLFYFLCGALILSSFLCSINLTDKLRGSSYSPLAVTFKISGQELFFDPISGPIFSDYSKRKQKMKYVKEVLDSAGNVDVPTVVISGWWYNEIMVALFPDNTLRKVVFEPYINSEKINDYINEGYEIKYLPEQNVYNDQMFKMSITDMYSSEF